MRWVIAAVSSMILAGCICDSVKRESEELKAAAVACKAGDRCVVVSLYDLVGPRSCLGALQCSAAFNSKTDQAEFSRKAKELAADFRRCGECAMADCVEPGGKAECNVAAGHCEMVR